MTDESKSELRSRAARAEVSEHEQLESREGERGVWWRARSRWEQCRAKAANGSVARRKADSESDTRRTTTTTWGWRTSKRVVRVRRSWERTQRRLVRDCASTMQRCTMNKTSSCTRTEHKYWTHLDAPNEQVRLGRLAHHLPLLLRVRRHLCTHAAPDQQSASRGSNRASVV